MKIIENIAIILVVSAMIEQYKNLKIENDEK